MQKSLFQPETCNGFCEFWQEFWFAIPEAVIKILGDLFLIAVYPFF